MRLGSFMVAGATVGALAGSAMATTADLTHASTATIINGARFETSDFRPAGTGFINSFVRVRATGVEQGYNTSGRPVAFNELTDPNFTRDIRLSQVPIRMVGSTSYREFLLDINESANGTEALVSLDQLRIFTSTTGGRTTANVGQLGTQRFNLDQGADNAVILNYRLNAGSGQGDMRLLVPESAFSGASPSDFVYLYSSFGTINRSNAGFEEWAVVPAPVSLATLALLLMMPRRRRRVESVRPG